MEDYSSLIELLKTRKSINNRILADIEFKRDKQKFYKKIRSLLIPNFRYDQIRNFLRNNKSEYGIEYSVEEVLKAQELLDFIDDKFQCDNFEILKSNIDFIKFDKEERKRWITRILNNIFRIFNNDFPKEDKVFFQDCVRDGLKLREILNSIIDEKVYIVLEQIEKYDQKVRMGNFQLIEEEALKENQKIDLYLNLFRENKIVEQVNNISDLENLLIFLQNLNINNEEMLKIRKYIIKYIENKKLLIEAEKNKENLNFLTKEEKNIYEYIRNEIIDTENNYERVDCSILKDNYLIESRKKLYFNNGIMNFSFIISDLKENLLPNLEKNKESIIAIFEYIISIYKEYLVYLKRVSRLKEERRQLQNILKRNKSMLNYYSSLSEFNKKLFENLLFNLSNNGNIDINLATNQLDKPIGYFERFIMLNKIQEIIELIENELNLNTILDDDYNDLLELSFEIQEEYEKNEEECILPQDEEFIDEEGLNAKTCMYLLNDDYNTYTKMEKIILKRSVSNLIKNNWQEYLKSSHEGELKPVYYTKPNGKKELLKGDNFDVLRIRINSYRVGIVPINVSKENNDKLYRRYKLTGPLVIFLQPFYVPGADHSAYDKYIVSVVRKMETTIKYWSDLFSDPNANEEELFQIIDGGFDKIKKLMQKQSENIK